LNFALTSELKPLQAYLVTVVMISPSLIWIALDKIGLDLDLFGKKR